MNTPRVVVFCGLVALGACSGDDDPRSEAGAATTVPAISMAVTTGPAAAGVATTAVPATTSSTTSPTTTVADQDVPVATAAAPSAGCGAAATAAQPGQQQSTILSSGAERSFYFHVPPAHDGVAPLPLIVDFHGYSEGAEIHVLMSGLGPFGDEHGFVTITPQGTGPVPRWDTTLGSPDLVFVGDLLDHAEATLCIDTNRIFAAGLSNGAFMSSAVACAYADRVAAVAPVAGIRDVPGCAPARPVPVVAFHGTADGFVAYDGGLGEQALDLPAPDGSGRTLREVGVQATPDAQAAPIPAITEAWAARNGCSGQERETRVATDVAVLTYGCPVGAEVELYRVDGGGHSWPGSDFSAQVASIVGATTFSIDADEVMWAFFQAHPLPAP